eukprot:2690489-Prymnesium_polylepis.1
MSKVPCGCCIKLRPMPSPLCQSRGSAKSMGAMKCTLTADACIEQATRQQRTTCAYLTDSDRAIVRARRR